MPKWVWLDPWTTSEEILKGSVLVFSTFSLLVRIHFPHRTQLAFKSIWSDQVEHIFLYQRDSCVPKRGISEMGLSSSFASAVLILVTKAAVVELKGIVISCLKYEPVYQFDYSRSIAIGWVTRYHCRS